MNILQSAALLNPILSLLSHSLFKIISMNFSLAPFSEQEKVVHLNLSYIGATVFRREFICVSFTITTLKMYKTEGENANPSEKAMCTANHKENNARVEI